jgi:hypothetical protein
MRGLDQHVARVGSLGRWRLHAVDPITDLERADIGAERRHRAGKIIAEYHGKPTCPDKRQQSPAVALRAPHIDGIDRCCSDGDLDLAGRWLTPENRSDLEATTRRETHQGDTCRIRHHLAAFPKFLDNLTARSIRQTRRPQR